MGIESLIRNVKRKPEYKWEDKYSNRDMLGILSRRAFQILRGTFQRLFFEKASGLLFIGRNTSLRHCHLITAGKNLILEDNVHINALSHNGIRIGNNVSIARDSVLVCTAVVSHKGQGIEIGDGTGINVRAYIGGQGQVTIGKNVIIGPDVKIFSENHNFADLTKPIKDQGVARKPTIIKDNCWIGAGCIILAGVTIGEGCVVAAGSVVTKSVNGNSVIAGVPAKTIKTRI